MNVDGNLIEIGQMINPVVERIGLGGPMEGTVEVDETYVGGKEGNKHESKKLHAGRGPVGKQIVMGVRERKGRVAAECLDGVTQGCVHKFIRENVTPAATVYSDDHKSYLGLDGYTHQSVNHSAGEYVVGDCHTNGIESFWALLKRGHYGIFHTMTAKHIHRYIAEFEARWNMSNLGSAERVDTLLENTPGLRLTYEGLIA